MELNRKLVMTFKTTDDKKVSLTVDNPREDLTEEEVKTAMELIKEKNIFAPGGADLASLVSAKVVIYFTFPARTKFLAKHILQA